jgi:hypothetical protein
MPLGIDETKCQCIAARNLASLLCVSSVGGIDLEFTPEPNARQNHFFKPTANIRSNISSVNYY